MSIDYAAQPRVTSSARLIDTSISGAGGRYVTVAAVTSQSTIRARPLPLGTLLLAINQLAVMNQNGVDLAEAVEVVAQTCKHPRLADQMARIHLSLTQGLSFSAAISLNGEGFPETIAPLVAAGESSGNLPSTLKRIAEMLRGEIQLRGTVISALIYPVILVGASTLVLLALMMGVIPQFAKVFQSLGKPVPATTQTLLWVGLSMRANWLWWSLGSAGLVTAAIVLRRHPVVTRPVRAVLMHGPLIKDAYRPLMTGRIFRVIASMISGGVPLLDSVRLARRTTSDPYWRELLGDMIDDLLQGSRASEAMRSAEFLPPEAAQLMATAEKAGRIADVLEDVGLFYEEDAARRIKRLVAALEPVIIMCMGVLVAGIVMSVMLPMLDITSVR